jgi:tRNA(adenine34) deaminase
MLRRHSADLHGMRLALEEAQAAAAAGNVPVGAVLMRGGEVLARGRNGGADQPLAHAELSCLLSAEHSGALGRGAREETTLFVTLEPCAMCAGAIVVARIPRLIFGAWDPKAGMAGSLHDLLRHPKLNHWVEVGGGVLADECGALLSSYFDARR